MEELRGINEGALAAVKPGKHRGAEFGLASSVGSAVGRA